MKINKTKNALSNILYGSINKFLSILFPFIIRTIIINVLGIEYLGLNSLFTSILNILNLAELGFGTAMVYSMYKPIAEDDTNTINALLNLYKKIYRIIGCIVLVVGLAIIPFLQYFIKGSYPADINLYTLYLVFLSNNVISYFFFAYKTSLLAAHQKNNVTSKIQIITSTLMYVAQIVVLFCFKNYYVYIIFLPLSTLALNLLTAIITQKQYPQYFCKGQVTTEQKSKIKKQIYALFLHKIGYVIQASIDNICISAFLGLTLLGKYNNYYYIITAIQGFMTILKQSLIAGIGNSIITESKDLNKKFFYKIMLIFAWIVGWCSTCLLCLYQPFMNVWVKEANMLSFSVVVCLTILFYTAEIRSAIGIYKDALGMWHEDRFKPICISAVNLVGTLLSAYFGWFEGIILSTAVAYLFVGLPWETFIFYKKYMQEKTSSYYLKQLFYLITTLFTVISTYYICSLIQLVGIPKIIVNGSICLIVPNIIFMLAYCNTPEFKNLIKGKKLMAKLKSKIKSALRAIYKRVPHTIKSDELISLNRRHSTFLKLQKKYSKLVDNTIACTDTISNYVFVSWLQGEEQAPALVKKCIATIKHEFKDKQVIIITHENLNQYTNFPEHILTKWKNGIITHTHFSDLLRVELLSKYGGVWIDATVFCTGNLDKYINKNTNLFVFRNDHRCEPAICSSSWLIYAKPNNPIIVNTKNILFKYWETNNRLKDYFLFHLIFSICAYTLKDEWDAVKFYTNIDPHILWFHYFDKPFNKESFEKIKEISNFHKLSYKFNSENIPTNSFYHYILGEYNEKN